MKTLKNYRHGDMAIIGISSLPKNLKSSKSKILLQNGSGGHSHSFDNGIFYPDPKEYEENGLKIIQLGFLKAKNTKLFHEEHSPKGGKIENGIYQIRRQYESIHGIQKPVID